MTWLEVQDGAEDTLTENIHSLLERLGKRKKVLAVPPDITRFHSGAGKITEEIWKYYREGLTDVLPALGTHAPMSRQEQIQMFGKIPQEIFRVHNWRSDPEGIGTIPPRFVQEVSEGAADYSIPMAVNRLLLQGGHDLILSIGQVVPHEVAGMSGHSKNILVGTGGVEAINKSHFLGGAFGMERVLGRIDSPVRKVFRYAADHFLKNLPLVHILTVVAPDSSGKLRIQGLFAGDDEDCFYKAAALAQKLNITMLEEAPRRIVVYLNPEEFRSTWLGNKAVYRTRMALAEGGELIILAPGIKEFGEDAQIDRLIRKYGYAGRKNILSLVQSEKELKESLSTAAHLIHGSSDGKFSIRYCPGKLSRQEIEGAGYSYGELEEMRRRYPPGELREGYNTLSGGERVYFIDNPAKGLWMDRARFAG